MFIDDGGEFERQAIIARGMGSEFVAEVLEAGKRQLYRAPLTARLIEDWQGDRGAAAVALRFNGALHALARRGATPALAAMYRDLDADPDEVLGEAMAQEDAFIADWMQGPPQTNEVGRAAAIMAALAVVTERFGHALELLELGSSAGLHLNMARYGYDLAGVRVGEAGSAVQLAPEWRGAPPPDVAPAVASAWGVDVAPLDAADPATRERLLAYVWADDRARSARLERALDIAAAHPPRVDRADAPGWLRDRLGEEQAAGTTRVVFHSIVLQYLSPEGREAVRAAIEAAGAGATDERPLAWVSFEWDVARGAVELVARMWPGGGEPVRLAICQAHAAWIEWHGREERAGPGAEPGPAAGPQ